jgi:glycosyltransferase involved in cell wall biosynthesis
MKILFAAHAPWRQTGYGTPVVPMARALESLGHPVMLMAVDSPKGQPGLMEYRGFEVALMNRDQFGQDIVASLVRYFEADLVLSLFDPWVLEKGYGQAVSGVPWLAWAPVDQEPLAFHLADVLKQADRTLVYSQWGLKVLERAGLGERARVLPLIVHTDIFQIPTAEEVAEMRTGFGFDDRFTVGLIGTNLTGDRKALAEQIEGFCLFADEMGHDKVRLFFAGDPFGPVHAPRMLDLLGCGDCAIFLEDWARNYIYSNQANLHYFYQSIDVLLHASAAEGFGMCIGEAMACGTPAIVNRNTSMPEVAGGLSVEVTGQVRRLSPQGGWWLRPTPEGVRDALVEHWNRKVNGHLPSKADLRQAALRFSPECVKAMMAPILDELEAER